jgi:hypothetical protein
MSETSSDKTKRMQVELLQSYQWVTQISYFYPDYEDSRDILEDGKKIRKRIGRLNPDVVFLCKLRFRLMSTDLIDSSPSDKQYVTMPYWTIYSSKSFNAREADHFLPKGFSDVILTKIRAVVYNHIYNAVRAIKGQKLYNVEKHLGAKANSYYVINKAMLSQYQLTQESTSEEQDTQTPEGFL